MEIKIRAAKTSDIERLTEIYNEEVIYGVSTFDIHPKTPNERMAWLEEHNIGNHPLLVAEVCGEIAGYASLSSYRDKEAYAAAVELSVYIASAWRNKGIATALIRAILAIAEERTDIHTVISVITSGNEASIRLHKKFGFVYCGELKEVGEKFGRKLGIVNYQKIV